MLFEKHRRDTRPGIPLTHELAAAMVLFSEFVDGAAESQCHIFKDTLRRMNTMKDCFAIVNVHDSYVWRSLRQLDPSKESDRIIASVNTVEVLMEKNPVCGASKEIHLLLEKLGSVEYDAAIDEEISGIALLDEIRIAKAWSQLGPFQTPHESLNMLSDASLTDKSQPTGSTFSLPDKGPRMDFGRTKYPSLQELGPQLRKFFEAPWPKYHNSPTWLEKVTRSRECLAVFWQDARVKWTLAERRLHGSLRPGIREVIGAISYDLTPRFLEEMQREKELGEIEVQRMQATQTPHQITPQALQTVWGSEDESTKGVLPKEDKHTKVKTTGSITADRVDISTPGVDDEGGSHARTDHAASSSNSSLISVNQNSLGVFQKMFSSSTGSIPGSVKWTHLVQALTDGGLVATQAPGSAVAFSNGSAGAINFHKPHEPVVDALMLRCMGKRLRKWFGWTGDRFVLRVKEGESPIV
jgi:hypothetical protein